MVNPKMPEQADNIVGHLRLLARDGDDLAVMSTLLQDAIIPGADMDFDHQAQRFIIIANRFCWETPPLADITSSDGKPVHERRLCVINIGNVLDIQHQNWPPLRQDALFNLLAMRIIELDKGIIAGQMLQFDFSGGISLRAKVDNIDIVLADLDAGHLTSLHPTHAI